MKYEGFAQNFAGNKLGEIETGTKFRFPTSDSEENINNIEEHIIDSDEEIENLYD